MNIVDADADECHCSCCERLQSYFQNAASKWTAMTGEGLEHANSSLKGKLDNIAHGQPRLRQISGDFSAYNPICDRDSGANASQLVN